MNHPHHFYMKRLAHAVTELSPKSILFVEDFTHAGATFLADHLIAITSTLIDIPSDIENHAHTRWEKAQPERLPYADASFDLSLFCYSLHHCSAPQLALSEALRVAKQACVVFEPWFDTRLPSQQVAQRYDQIDKAFDREQAMIHHDCIAFSEMMQSIDVSMMREINIEHLLQICEATPEQINTDFAQLRSRAEMSKKSTQDIDELEALAIKNGITEYGIYIATFVKD
jgi:SAM-dependent methyltransferase